MGLGCLCFFSKSTPGGLRLPDCTCIRGLSSSCSFRCAHHCCFAFAILFSGVGFHTSASLVSQAAAESPLP